ncbi:MAG TPA: hypothetical protein VNH22_06330, partial [Blastocatellia bacterium]|nr:hypothetical protein [Blastocatellia bacterium]
MMKISTVEKQPPPSFLAPYPAISARKRLFIYWLLNRACTALESEGETGMNSFIPIGKIYKAGT